MSWGFAASIRCEAWIRKYCALLCFRARARRASKSAWSSFVQVVRLYHSLAKTATLLLRLMPCVSPAAAVAALRVLQGGYREYSRSMKLRYSSSEDTKKRSTAAMTSARERKVASNWYRREPRPNRTDLPNTCDSNLNEISERV